MGQDLPICQLLDLGPGGVWDPHTNFQPNPLREMALFEKVCICPINKSPKTAKVALNLTSEGLKYPSEVRVQHETCSTICGTHVQAILNQKNLTGLAGGVREGQDMAQNGPRLCTFLALEPSRDP